MRHVLVCGGAGYIGSHMTKALVANGDRVTVFDNLSTGHERLARWGDLIRGDVLHAQDLERAFQAGRVDAVMHFCARSIVSESVANPDLYYRNNVAGTLNLLHVMARHGVDKLVFSSTAAVYGAPQYTPIDEQHPTLPINPYGRSKLMVESLLGDYARAHGIRSVCLRYFNAAGADPDVETGECHDPETHLIPNILRAALSGGRESLKVFGNDYATTDGTCVRDYVHVTDLCDAHLRALAYLGEGGASEIFNLGSDAGFSVLDVIKSAEHVVGKPVAYQLAPRRAGDPPVLVATSTRARSVLGWEPRFSSLGQIIGSAWAWHRKQRH
jgi:UDP-glucose 4-epimerase